MRKIEEKIIDTIKAGKVGLYHLSCRDSVEISKNEIKVYLWDNLIFYKSSNVIRISSCGWQSTTTKSRLNALLSEYQLTVIQRDYIWKLWEVTSSLTFKLVPYFDGMEINIKSFEVK